MDITARFASRCPLCGLDIAVGTTVSWTRGSKARHIKCPERLAPVAYADGQTRHVMLPVRAKTWVAVWSESNNVAHVYEDERTARAHCALNEGWDGEVHLRPGTDNGRYGKLITFDSLVPYLHQYGLGYMVEAA